MDVTFRNYSSQQAADYAEGRLGYSEALIDFILDYHRTTNGQNKTILDVGCGPGSATRMLAPHFDVAYGADAGESMINTAKELGGATRNGMPIIYTLSTAEDIDKIDGITHGSLDMITAATAAHWFEMPKFWAAAAKLLKPGGTAAIWTVFKKDRSLGTRTELQSIFDDFRDNVLAQYTSSNTHLTMNGYVDLVMPWDDPNTASWYDRESFVRHELDGASGYLPGKCRLGDTSHGGDELFEDQLKKLEKLINTLGSVTRWQQAHPDLVGTENDCVAILIKKVCQAVKDGGGTIDLSVLSEKMTVALLLLKRK